MMWEAAMPGPRIVEVRQKLLRRIRGKWINNWKEKDEIADDLVPNPSVDDDLMGIRSACRPPQILSVCKESHSVTSKHYKKVFGRRASSPKTYFDFQRDILYLRHDTFPGYVKEHNLSCDNAKVKSMLSSLGECTDVETPRKVENVALLVDRLGFYNTAGIDDFMRECIRNVLLVFCNVKTLTLVVQHYKPKDGTGPTLVFMKPIDIDKALRQLRGYRGHNGDYGDGPRLSHVSPHKVDDHRLQRIKQDLKVPRELPVMNYQICLPESFMTKYETARTDCKARFHESISEPKLRLSFEESLPVAGDGRYCLRSTQNGKSRRAGS
jgi:hypothetical protein